jgi:hypothetical protein
MDIVPHLSGTIVSRCQSSHIFYTISSQMAVRLSALHAIHPLSPQQSQNNCKLLPMRAEQPS